MSIVIKKTCRPEDDLRDVVVKAVQDLGGFGSFIKKGDRVLIKPNFNTADPFPASSDPEFVRAVVSLAMEAGAGEVIVGDSSTFFQNTRKNMKKLGIFELEKISSAVKVVSFNEGKWIKKEIKGGRYLKFVSVPEILDKVDKIIILPCLKTHYIAKFTGALKICIGFMKPMERAMFHAGHTEEKIAEMNLVYKPDLVIMDGRKCFITGGPAEGEVREPNLILASTSRTGIDIEEVKIIKNFPGNSLSSLEIEDLVQIKKARQLSIG